jgi:membrane-associated protease RseP (regulator of RpoE activity)
LRDLPQPEDYAGLFYAPAPPPEKPRLFLPLLLFISAVVTTVVAGFWWHTGFATTTWEERMAMVMGLMERPSDLLLGLSFSVAILVILLAHELGHYLTCRYYGLKATLPHFIPAPPPLNPFGTFGAVIKIKSIFRDRRQLFDVGVAGPIGGFVFIVPAVIIGLQNSREFVFSDAAEGALLFGEPLLFRIAALLFFPGGPGTDISLHPIGWAAWFGMLATSINLLPAGQLDGGHIVYSLFGARGHRIASYGTFAALIALGLYSWPMPSYLIFALILLVLGFRHPRPYNDFVRPGKKRIAVAVLALVIFILTFMPVPVQMVEF